MEGEEYSLAPLFLVIEAHAVQKSLFELALTLTLNIFNIKVESIITLCITYNLF